jgi:ATP-binding cassette subfamily B protein
LAGTLQGLRTVVGANAQNVEVERLADRHAKLAGELVAVRSFRLLHAMAPLALALMALVAVGLYGLSRVGDGTLTPGALAAVLGYLAWLPWPVAGLLEATHARAGAHAAHVSVDALLETRPEVLERDDAATLTECRGAVRFEGVRAGAGPAGEGEADGGAAEVTAVLDGLDLHVEAGQTVSIVGAGRGGSALLRDLLTRQRDPERGQVRLDGRDLRDLRLEDVRRHVHVIERDPVIFRGTLRRNLLYGRPTASDFEQWEALEHAGLDRWVQGLEKGLCCTQVGEGGLELTVDQRRRLAVARAYLACPAVLVLEEPWEPVRLTSGNGSGASPAAGTTDTLSRLTAGRTTVVLTDDPDLARDADRIVVLRGGRVIRDGPPSSLLGGDSFRELFLDVLTG